MQGLATSEKAGRHDRRAYGWSSVAPDEIGEGWHRPRFGERRDVVGAAGFLALGGNRELTLDGRGGNAQRPERIGPGMVEHNLRAIACNNASRNHGEIGRASRRERV